MRALLKLTNKNVYIIQIKKYLKKLKIRNVRTTKNPLSISYLGYIQKITIICIFPPTKP